MLWRRAPHRAVTDTIRVRVCVWVELGFGLASGFGLALGLGLGLGVTHRAVAAVDREVRVGQAEDR